MIVLLILLAVIAPIVVVEPLQDDMVLPKLATTATFTGAVLVWGAVLLARDRWPAGRWPATLWAPVVVFVVVNVLALIFALDRRWSLMGEYLRYQGLATTLLYVLLFGVTAVAVRTIRDLRWLLLGLFAGALGAAIYALIQKAGLDWVGWSGRALDRPAATLGQANAFGAYLVAVISALPFLALSARGQDVRFRLAVVGALGLVAVGACILVAVRLEWPQRLAAVFPATAMVALLVGLAALVSFVPRLREGALQLAVYSALGAGGLATLFALLFTISRAAFVGAFVVLVIWSVAAVLWFVFYRFGRRPRPLHLAAASVAGVGVALAVLVPVVVLGLVGLGPGQAAVARVEAVGELESQAVGGRLSLWRMAVRMTADRPLLGHGQDAFTLLFADYRDRPDLPGIGTSNVEPESAHNFFLDLASGTGVLGLLAFLALVGAVLWHAGRRALATDDAPLRLALVALSAGVVGYLVALFFGFSEAMTSWVLWLLLGATAGLLAQAPAGSRQSDRPGPESGTLASGMGAVALTLLGVTALAWAATMTAADLAAGQADRAVGRREHAAAVRLAGRAVTLNPLQKEYLAQKARTYKGSSTPTGDKEPGLRQAVDTYETLVRRFEPSAFDVLGLATAKLELAQVEGTPVEDTFEDFERALKLDPYNALLRSFVADKYERLGYEDLALWHRVGIYCWSVACD